MASYHNPWIPSEARAILEGEKGLILDVGGGAAPYIKASHIVDIQPFDADRLRENRWGSKCRNDGVPEYGSEVRKTEARALGPDAPVWTEQQYTQLDLCGGKRWPFEDRQFDLGLCSHCLEDLRDPLPAVQELSRVCKRVLVITPSRLLEQTMGIDHPRYCGFYHHPWIVFMEGTKLVFRRKTALLNLPGCHIMCPYGMTLRVDQGTSAFLGNGCEAEERAFWSERDDYDDYGRFISPFRGRQDLFVKDPRKRGSSYWIWYMRQKYLGAV